MNLNQYKEDFSHFESGIPYLKPASYVQRALNSKINPLKAELMENPEEFHNLLNEFTSVDEKDLIVINPTDFNDFFTEIKKTNLNIKNIIIEQDSEGFNNIILKSSENLSAEERMNLIDSTFIKLMNYIENIKDSNLSTEFFVDLKIEE
jgi:hypothetical protein